MAHRSRHWRSTSTLSAAALMLLLLAAATVWWNTSAPSPKVIARRAAALTSAALVDETTYATSQRLASLATAAEERPLVESALRVADHELALAFTAALRDVEAHPPQLSPLALQIQDRLQKSQALLDVDSKRVAQLTAGLAQAKPSQKDEVQDDLQLAQSQLDLDNDEVEEANQDLVAAGGNPQLRIEAMVQEHDAQVKARAASAALPSAGIALLQHGAVQKIGEWRILRQKNQQLTAAQDAAAAKAATLGGQRVALADSLDASKGGIAALAGHTKTAKNGAAPATDAPGTVQAAHSHGDAAALLEQTRRITADQRVITLLDRQMSDQRQLAGIYQRWSAIGAMQAAAAVHALMLDALVVLGVLLLTLLLDRWFTHLLNRPALDRRQVETLRSIARISLRVIAAVVIILVVVGVPGQFGTMIGIVGAGLTVALKDFIVAFFGWLVLMGRNGIRLGDWVEINGVSGEVIELGMFHTVLLETGNWSDAGHPTGRRVTFTNSFAIEKHYFNFSTSGQWLWDELQVVVPAGQDPYPIVDSLTKRVIEATAESSRLAELEWQRAVPSQRAKHFSGAPGISLKPVMGGIELAVRYLTRADERFALRATLFQAAVELMGHKQPSAAVAGS